MPVIRLESKAAMSHPLVPHQAPARATGPKAASAPVVVRPVAESAPAIVPAAGLVPEAVRAIEASSTRVQEPRTAPARGAAPIVSATGTCRALVVAAAAAAETAMP